MMPSISDVSVQPLDLELEHSFEIALGTRHHAANLLVTVRTDDGVRGYGEGSPVPPVTGETQAAAIETARSAATLLDDQPIAAYRALVNTLRSTFPGMGAALFAVETAVLDAYCRTHDLPLAALFGGVPTPVETGLTIPILPPSTAADRADQATRAGFDHLKIKTGTTVESDVDRVLAVADAAPDATLTVDANQGWTPTETTAFTTRVADHGIDLDLVEQPVPAADHTGLARVRDAIDAPVAADEAVFTPEDAIAIVRADAADVINAKLGKSGPLAVADIAAIARGANLELMIGCMLESAIGIHTSAHVVSGLDSFAYVDLDGNRLLADDLIDDAGPVHDIAGPGHGIIPE